MKKLFLTALIALGGFTFADAASAQPIHHHRHHCRHGHRCHYHHVPVHHG